MINKRNSSRSEAPLLGGAGDNKWVTVLSVAALLGIGAGAGSIVWLYCRARGDEFAEIYNEENIYAKGCLLDSSGDKFMVKIMRNEAGMMAYVIYMESSDRPMIEIAIRADRSRAHHRKLYVSQLKRLANLLITEKGGGETTQNLRSALEELKPKYVTNSNSFGIGRSRDNSEFETLLLQVVREIIIISNPIDETTQKPLTDLLPDNLPVTDDETRSSLQM